MNSFFPLHALYQFSHRLITSVLASGAVAVGTIFPALASVPVPYSFTAQAGTSTEQNLLLKNAGSVMQDECRRANMGQFWIYGFPVAPGARCTLTLTLNAAADTTPPTATVLGADNKPLAIHTETTPNTYTVVWTAPIKWPVGSRISVMLSAKNGSVEVKSLELSQALPDSSGEGLPDVVRALLTTGLPANTRINVVRSPTQPFTVTGCDQPITPSLDVQTDAIFSKTVDPAIINGWKSRGYAVWSFGSSKVNDAFAQQNPDAMQMRRDGKPAQAKPAAARALPIDEQTWASAAPTVLARDRSLFTAALIAGIDGACFLEPDYLAAAGYEPAFKQAWQTEYSSPWLDPISSLDARYHASRLMAQGVSSRVQSAMQGVSATKPNARRMVAVQSLLNGAEQGLISPISRIAGLNEVTDILAEVDTNTTGSPIRYVGLRQERPFDRAYLEYSSLLHAARGTNKRTWFQLTPTVSDTSSSADLRARFEHLLVAALLFPDINAYYLAMPYPLLTSTLPADDQVRLQSLLNTLEDMHNQTGISGNADKDDDIGVLVSDSIQWQREGPSASDLDGLFGLTLPFLQRGIPVQVLSLDRVADPGYLNGFKTLLVSYDFQKPLGTRTQQALVEWVRRGGSLIYVGGTDAYNRVTDSWWQQAKFVAPQMDLWQQFGLNIGNPTTRMAPAEDVSRYASILKTPPNSGIAHRLYTIDLTRYASSTGSVAIRFSAQNTDGTTGAYVSSGELAVGGKVSAAFTAGSEIENRFLVFDNNSRFNNRDRIAEGTSSWTYQFDNLPENTPVTLTLDMGGDFNVSAASAQPEFGHTLLNTGVNIPLSKAFPRLRIGAAYPATLYQGAQEGKNAKRQADSVGAQFIAPSSNIAPISNSAPAANIELSRPFRPGRSAEPGTNRALKGQSPPLNAQSTILYTLRAGGAPIWTQNIGRGLLLNVGIAPGFFSASERSAGLLRALTRFAHQRAGGNYREPGFLRLQRGRYTIVHTFSEPVTVEGRMIDLLSPTLNTADDRVIPPDSSALLYDLGNPDAEPHIGFVAGRLQARLETSTTTGFVVRAASGTSGVARLHRGGRRMIGARGTDWLGNSVPVQAQEDGGTVLLHYPNSPDGVIIRVGWQ